MFDIDNIMANSEAFLANLHDGGDKQDVVRIYIEPTPDGEGLELSKSFSEIAEAMMAGKLVAVQQYSFTTTTGGNMV